MNDFSQLIKKNFSTPTRRMWLCHFFFGYILAFQEGLKNTFKLFLTTSG